MVIYQHVDEYRKADGIGNDVFEFYKILRSLGFETFVVCRLFTFAREDYILHPDDSIHYTKEDIHIFHYGGAGYPFEYFITLPGKKILRYHNVTPAVFFRETDEDIFKSMNQFETRSLLELNAMQGEVELVLSGSRYNAVTLEEMGYKNILLFPVITDYSKADKPSAPGKKIGFIGRIVPNKKFEDIIRILYYLKKIDAAWEGVFIGSFHPYFRPYYEKIVKLISDMGLDSSVTFRFNLTDAEKKLELSSWAAYVSMSEHEGFGIPLLESFAAGVPVIAFKSSGIAETLRKGGILVKEKDYLKIAGMADELYRNHSFRKKIIMNQYTALGFYQKFPFKKMLADVIHGLTA